MLFQAKKAQLMTALQSMEQKDAVQEINSQEEMVSGLVTVALAMKQLKERQKMVSSGFGDMGSFLFKGPKFTEMLSPSGSLSYLGKFPSGKLPLPLDPTVEVSGINFSMCWEV